MSSFGVSTSFLTSSVLFYTRSRKQHKKQPSLPTPFHVSKSTDQTHKSRPRPVSPTRTNRPWIGTPLILPTQHRVPHSWVIPSINSYTGISQRVNPFNWLEIGPGSLTKVHFQTFGITYMDNFMKVYKVLLQTNDRQWRVQEQWHRDRTSWHWLKIGHTPGK